jgi:predicted XRE-type DNA-binding protein
MLATAVKRYLAKYIETDNINEGASISRRYEQEPEIISRGGAAQVWFRATEGAGRVAAERLEADELRRSGSGGDSYMGRVGNVSSDLHRAKAGGGVRLARIPKKIAGDKPGRSGSRSAATGKPAVTLGRKGEAEYEEFDSVWNALGFSAKESANLAARSNLMIQISKIVESSGWTQAEAAKQCKVSQPRINNLLRGYIDRFSLDALVNIATALGRKVRIDLEAA